MFEWIQCHQVVLTWLVGVSIFTLTVTLIVIPWFICTIPSDYFMHRPGSDKLQNNQYTFSKLIILVLKNLLGLLFILMGIIMLFLPGQGLLTILAGIMLVNFPGKYKFQCWFVSRQPVYKSVNWLRKRAGKDKLDIQSYMQQIQ